MPACPNVRTKQEEQGFKLIAVPTPRIEQKQALRIAGVNATLGAHAQAAFQRIPQAWQLLAQQIPTMPAKTNAASPFPIKRGEERFTTYQVCFGNRAAKSFNFMPGLEVTDFKSIKPGFTGITLPARKYVVFSFEGRREDIGNLRYSISKLYWRRSKYKISDAPNLAVYPPDDDPNSDMVKMEFWVAIQP